MRCAGRIETGFRFCSSSPTTALATRKGSSRNAPPLLWPELTKLAHGLHLPHFPVDGEDAVAVYRVMQETSARARSGGGPSVIWAMLSAERLAPRQQPLKRLDDLYGRPAESVCKSQSA